jgi:hypothetical protein
MKATILGLSIALAAAGCQSGGNSYNPKTSAPELAAYAASVTYPSNSTPMTDTSITSTVDRRSGAITIRNYTNKTIVEPRLWVNRMFVLRLPTISAQSTIKISKDDLYDSAGRSMASQPTESIKRIELQTEQNLIDVQGPLFE